MLYESYIHPITILSGLPSAGLGALVTLWLFGNELNIYSFVGLIMLIGIVKKNAIMQIDFALDAERQHGKTPTEAIYEGCLIRFRPIMMTTHGGAARRAADRARLRRRRRGAPAARPRRRRRSARLAAHHAVSDAGRLHLHGGACVKTRKIRRSRRRRLAATRKLMNISEGFIRRPIATSLLMAAIALFGAVAYRSLPVSDLPNVDFPTLLVTAQLPGASPETMGASVATPLENQFSTIAGLESMTSVNSLGSTQITLEFDSNRSLDGAAVDVQGAITQAARLLPQGMPTPPTFTKVNPADQPILYLVDHVDDAAAVDARRVRRDAHRAAHLEVSGVAQVQVLGSQKYAVHAQLDPHALAARQIGINEVESGAARTGTSTCRPAHHRPAPGVHAAGHRPADERRRSIKTHGRRLPQRRAGAARTSSARSSTASRIRGPRRGSTRADGEQRAITLGIQRQPGTNTIAVADAVKALLPQFRAELPASVHMDVLYDRSDTIRESYRDVQFTMLLTLASSSW